MASLWDYEEVNDIDVARPCRANGSTSSDSSEPSCKKIKVNHKKKPTSPSKSKNFTLTDSESDGEEVNAPNQQSTPTLSSARKSLNGLIGSREDQAPLTGERDVASQDPSGVLLADETRLAISTTDELLKKFDDDDLDIYEVPSTSTPGLADIAPIAPLLHQVLISSTSNAKCLEGAQNSDPLEKDEDCSKLKLWCQSKNGKVPIRINRSSNLQSLINTFCKHAIQSDWINESAAASLKFIFDGEPLNGTRTPDAYDMEDGDVIEVLGC